MYALSRRCFFLASLRRANMTGMYFRNSSTRPAATYVKVPLKTQFCHEDASSARRSSCSSVNPETVARPNSVQNSVRRSSEGRRTAPTAWQMPIWTTAAAAKPRVPLKVKVQMSGSISAWRAGEAFLRFFHFLQSTAVGTRLRGERRAAFGDVVPMSRRADGGPR